MDWNRDSFFFYSDDRLVLVGVLSDNIARNNYYDGPFDQVPPNLNIKQELETVYPYVKLRGGIDQHGNFVSQHGVRVAISPYIVYSDTSEFVKEVSKRFEMAKRNNTSFLTELVYEWKSNFSPGDIAAGDRKELESKEMAPTFRLNAVQTTEKLDEHQNH